MEKNLNNLNMTRFIVDCDENYDVVFKETNELVDNWKTIHAQNDNQVNNLVEYIKQNKMNKTNFSNNEIKEIADFAMNNKEFQKEQQELTNSVLEMVKQNRVRQLWQQNN